MIPNAAAYCIEIMLGGLASLMGRHTRTPSQIRRMIAQHHVINLCLRAFKSRSFLDSSPVLGSYLSFPLVRETLQPYKCLTICSDSSTSYHGRLSNISRSPGFVLLLISTRLCEAQKPEYCHAFMHVTLRGIM